MFFWSMVSCSYIIVDVHVCWPVEVFSTTPAVERPSSAASLSPTLISKVPTHSYHRTLRPSGFALFRIHRGRGG